MFGHPNTFRLLRSAWERYRLLAFLVVAVAVVVVVVSPLTGCAAAPARTSSTPTKQWAAPTITPGENQASTNTSVLPALVIAGALVLMAKRHYGNTTYS